MYSIFKNKRRNERDETPVVLPRRSISVRRPRPCEPECLLRCLRLASWPDGEREKRESLLRQSLADAITPLAESPTSTPKTPYQPLRPWQTRLIQLVSTWPDPPKCQLTTVEFIDMAGVGVAGTDEVVTYTAISYVWGSPDDDCELLLDDCPVRISWNLAQCLYVLSSSLTGTASRYFWCDALCINQRNVAEKSLQVRNMLRIFEKAEQVYAWLNIDSGFITRWGSPIVFVDPLDHLRQSDGSGSVKHSEECLTNLEQAQDHLRGMTANRFFSRTWIRQEIFAAREFHLILGDVCGPATVGTSIPFDKAKSNFFAWLTLNTTNSGRISVQTTDALFSSELDVEPRFQTMCKHFQHNGTDRHAYRPPARRQRYAIHWLSTLQDGVSFQVGDDRDRVYGVLGIITSPTTRLYVEDRPDIKPQNFPISYEKTVSEVYQDVIKFLIETDRNLDCLSIFEEKQKRAKDLPSWVTDWRRNAPRSMIAAAADDTARSYYGAIMDQTNSKPGTLLVEVAGVFSIKVLKAIRSWPQDMKEAKSKFEPHIIFNTMGWLDDSVLDLHGSYAECEYLVPSTHTRRRMRNGLSEVDAAFAERVAGFHMRDSYFQHLKLYVPRTARLGDVIVAFSGAKSLFVLRKVREATCKLVGPILGYCNRWEEGGVSRPVTSREETDDVSARLACEEIFNLTSGALSSDVEKIQITLV